MPVERYGVRLLSIGFFVDPGNAIVWRGGMASNALKQLITEAAWGDLDYFVIDLPPGTSDVHLTLVQTIQLTGSVIVTTPQDVALADARKGINMFRNDKINVPILGLIENMAWFTPPSCPKTAITSSGATGASGWPRRRTSPARANPHRAGHPRGRRRGVPAALHDDRLTAQAFAEVARKLVAECGE